MRRNVSCLKTLMTASSTGLPCQEPVFIRLSGMPTSLEFRGNGSLGEPIQNLQPLDSLKLADSRRHHVGLDRQSMGGNQQIIVANRRTGALQIGANFSVACARLYRVIKQFKARQKFIQRRCVSAATRAFTNAEAKLGNSNCGNADFAKRPGIRRSTRSKPGRRLIR